MSLPQPLPRVPSTDEIVPIMQRIIEKQNSIRNLILQTTTPDTATFSNVMLPLAQVENEVQGEHGMIEMLQYGSPSLTTQGAFDEARKMYLEASGLWTADVSFFKLLQAAKEEPGFDSLDKESQHLLEKELLCYKHAGHGILSDTQLEGYRTVRVEIEGLKRAFQQNLAREAGGVNFTVEELDGVPREELAKWKEEIPGAGVFFIPFVNGGTRAVLTYARCPETRRRMFLANNRKLKENQPLFEEIIKLRSQQARLLNYSTHADFRIETRMAKSVEWVKEFLNDLQMSLVRYGREEIAVLQDRRMKDLRTSEHYIHRLEKGFPPWDEQYYKRLVQEEFEVDQHKVSEFFPLEQTAIGMLGIFTSLLGLRFDPIPTDILTGDLIWHDTVQGFSVWDMSDNGFIGYLYFDLLWRENKYRGNQCVNIQCGYQRPDGTRQFPSTILMCSFPTQTATSCALLKHHQVVTLFHGKSIVQLGHGIHDLLARTNYTHFHGYRLPPDFGEMPSTLLENWCWMEDVLHQLSCHYTTLDANYLKGWREQHPGEPDPPKKPPHGLIENLVKHRYSHKGLYYLHQLSVSIFDLQIHSVKTDEDIANLNIQTLWYDLREEIEGMDFSDCRDGFEFASFSHLTAGYDVCYYAYSCCNAMAQDVFLSKFADDPHNKANWEKYRRGILEYGGSQKDLLGMLEAFLGRPVNMNALGERLSRAKNQI
ncbi:peptidase family M3 [Penicillium odoratum]|uniref:peptidase family M3 n=1 Tax=Penicillium odoratum TaxID=1167516 RepID=UPI002548C27A|nr:peptidase family M3 [Penicillium odoratum]KAJ5776809.1 peptidase family M3 [Penicillium odoratum]